MDLAHVIEAVGVKNREVTGTGLSFQRFLAAYQEACQITGRISVKQALTTATCCGNMPSPRGQGNRLPSAFKSKANKDGWSSLRSENPSSSAHSSSSFELPKINESIESRSMSKARLGTSSLAKESKDENVIMFDKIVGRLESLLQARHQQDENAAGSRALLDLIKGMAQRVDVLEASDKNASTMEQVRTKRVDSELSVLSKSQDQSKVSIQQCSDSISSLDSQLARREAELRLLLDENIRQSMGETEDMVSTIEANQSNLRLEFEVKYAEMEAKINTVREDQATTNANQAVSLTNVERQVESLVYVFQSFQSSTSAALAAKDEEIASLKSSVECANAMLVTLREEYLRMLDEAAVAVAERNERIDRTLDKAELRTSKTDVLIQEMDARISNALSEASRANDGIAVAKADSLDPLSHRVGDLESKVESLSSEVKGHMSEAEIKPQAETSLHSDSFLEPLKYSIQQLEADLVEQKQLLIGLLSSSSLSPLEHVPSSSNAMVKALVTEEMNGLCQKALASEESVSSHKCLMESKILELEKNISDKISSASAWQESLLTLTEQLKGLEERLPLAQTQTKDASSTFSSSDETSGKLAAFEHKIASTLQQMHHITTQKLGELSAKISEIEKKGSLGPKQYQSNRVSPSKI